MKTILSIAAAFFVAVVGCSNENPLDRSPGEGQDTATVERGVFAKGADVSWVTQLESEGYKFYNSKGEEMECMKLLRDECGVDAIRLRVWVNPEGGWSGIDDVVAKARRASELGLRLMVDFHFSDHWADPGQQETPKAWAGYDLPQLKKAVAGHVTEVLSRLKSMGIEPEWVQVGNETRDGMLYPLGKCSENGGNFAELVNSGYDAVKSVFPDANVIIHLDKGDTLEIYTYIFDNLAKYGGKYDMIGMSLYPEPGSWEKSVDDCVANIRTLSEKYGKPVMICEIGMAYNQAGTAKNMISRLKDLCENNTGGQCKGIFYWEPEAPAGYNGGYDKGCFIDGRPTEALDPFKEK